ncbi:zinc finger protein 391-like [Protopterus annectens]|uniref:zinc finger protein 391-like n=1 Tax=Protopterus annectens TaxID=7888 RepID=UPI001CFBA93F|nr:zinc finger protein 391-like [Protopterus annectens]
MQEFAKLHQFLHDKEQTLIQQLKDEEAEILKEMQKSVESIRIDVMATHVTVSDASLELGKKVIGTLKETEENSVVTIQKVISKDILEPVNQKTTCFLTAPETFEDVAVTFSEEEWKMLTKQDKDLHREVMVQNYESLVSVGYKILPEKLLLLLKQDSDEQPKCDVEGKHITKQQGNQEGGFSSIESMESSASSSLQSSLAEPKLHHSAANLQKCAESGQDSGKYHVMPASQLHSGCNCSQSCGCATNHSVHIGKKLYTGAESTKWLSHNSSSNLIHCQTIYKVNPPPVVQSCDGMMVPKHLKELKRNKPYKCAECSKCFSYNIQLIHHQTVHTGKILYKCTECSKCFTQKYNLQCHQKLHGREKPYKCAECSKYFTRLSSLQRHCIIHTGEKPYNCMECGKCFTQSAHLKEHQNTHRGETPYKCTECSRCFTRLSSLQRHLIIHSEKKPYSCSECNKCFITKGQLTTHLYSHSGEKPYKCVECNKGFTSKTSLKHHSNWHRGEKPYKCVECSKGFICKNSLKYHQNVHRGEKPYKCVECNKCFTHPGSLWYHHVIHVDIKL